MLNLAGANTTEIDPDAEHAIVIDMPEYNPGMMGSTMRLGKRTTVFAHDNSVLSKCEMKVSVLHTFKWLYKFELFRRPLLMYN